MAAIKPLVARELVALAKRSNWAAENKGVMVVFCIVGVVAIFLIGLAIYKAMLKRRNAKATF
ncbi:unnamed protein product [Clonostachys rosea]|uniref:Uncharacterized protein n=1 Tax=Bionectria ochroleuca TaxID=29856 RepID=A0ABY6V3Q6_BIOOC|nr:unnamed protein product [Clonostachys rosea]